MENPLFSHTHKKIIMLSEEKWFNDSPSQLCIKQCPILSRAPLNNYVEMAIIISLGWFAFANLVTLVSYKINISIFIFNVLSAFKCFPQGFCLLVNWIFSFHLSTLNIFTDYVFIYLKVNFLLSLPCFSEYIIFSVFL